MPRTHYDLTDCDLDAKRDESERRCARCENAAPEFGSPYCPDCIEAIDEEE